MDVIATHSNADFDGLASMVAARKLFPGAKLVLPAGGQETVRNFLDLYDLGLCDVVNRTFSPVGGVVVGEPRTDRNDEVRFTHDGIRKCERWQIQRVRQEGH